MPISEFCEVQQHLKYIAHVIRLPGFAIQKQLLFTTERKKFSRDPWLKVEIMLGQQCRYKQQRGTKRSSRL